MNEQSIRARLGTIEEQIRVLKGELATKPARKPARRFSDLYGIWKGKVDLTFEEIQEAEIRLKDDH